jgi:NAD(P)-dependent dehydrogenase (short-subunit alcohol dehydrogenase family)
LIVRDLNMKLKDKVAIVTGATSGMGAAIAKLFAAEGSRIVVAGRNRQRGTEVVNEINRLSGEAIFVECDVSSNEGNQHLVKETLRFYGAIDIVVMSAGMLGLGSITEVSLETWHETINTNLNSVFYLLRSVIPEMKKREKGNIIIIGSIAAQKAFPNHPAYCATKGALVPLVKQIALDYGPEIRANVISPGPIDTPLIWDSAKAFPDPEKAVADAANATVLKRLGTPDDVAKAALFLATEDSSFITGTTLVVDGGRLIS